MITLFKMAGLGLKLTSDQSHYFRERQYLENSSGYGFCRGNPNKKLPRFIAP